MKRSFRSCVLGLLGFVTVFAVHANAGPAYEKVTLETHWTDITCSVTFPGYASTPVSCSSLSFSAAVPPGGTVSISATLNWTYTDDGLALDRPFAFQIDPYGLQMQPVDHESALVAVISTFCGRAVCPPPEVGYSGPGYLAFVLGSNDVPDALTGSRTFTASATLSSTWPSPEVASVFLGSLTMIQEVPEPSTHAMLLAGLLGVAALRSRRASTAPRSASRGSGLL